MKLVTLPLVMTATAMAAACNSDPTPVSVSPQQGPADIVATIDTIRPDSAGRYAVHVMLRNAGSSSALVGTCPVGVQQLTPSGWTAVDEGQCPVTTGSGPGIEPGQSIGVWSSPLPVMAGDSIRDVPVSAIIPPIPAGAILSVDGAWYRAGTPSAARVVPE